MALNINGTTGISGVDASVAAPALKGSDSNTGISFGSDSIKFSTAGVERISITNSGISGTGITGGKLRQAKATFDNALSQFSTTSTSYVDITDIKLVFTPTANDSLFYFFHFFHAYQAANTTQIFTRLTYNHSGVSQTTLSAAQDAYSQSIGGVFRDLFHVQAYQATGLSTNEVTIQAQMKASSGTQYYNRVPSKIFMLEMQS